MAQSLATQHGGESNPLDTTGLCLLSLDGGGVRGLSALYILKGLMTRLNNERDKAGLPRVKPCEVFDLIGGTSTGGLIAIMLGRLEMDVDECITSYSELMKAVFEKKSSWLRISRHGKVKAQFDSAKLKSAVDEAISKTPASSADAFNDGKARGCRTFVCATAKETAGITRLRSYALLDEGEIPATIGEAALATSAATGFFDPVLIGARQFVDGALGANNPVDEVEGEAANIWTPDTGDLKPLVKCFVSIGTGHPGKKALEDNIVKFLSKSLVGIATETEETERKFIARWAKHYDEKRYFRFNVDQGLQEVGLAEYKEQGRMQAATDEYLRHQGQKFRVRDCVENLQQKQSVTKAWEAHNVHWIVPRAVNSLFTGRSQLVSRLESALRSNSVSTTERKQLVITGIGGIGKSEVCLRVADLLREDFWGVFWVDVGSPSTAKNGFLAIAKALGSSVESVEESLQALTNTPERWLLVLDNADDPTFDYAAYIPSGKQGAVIVTSRVPECSQYSTLPAEALESLEDEHSTQLLLKAAHVPEASWQACGEQAQAIVELLGSHTLALIQAGAYIAEGYCRLDQYVDKYKRLRKRLLKHYPKQQQSRYQHVYATFEASVGELDDSEDGVGRDALDLLGVLSMLHSSVLPLHVFAGAWRGARHVLRANDNQLDGIDALGQWHVSRLPEFIDGQADEWDDYRLNRASALLTSLALVTRHRLGDLDGLSMHPLAHAWAKDRQEQEQQQAAWASAGCILALSRGESETWRVYERQLRPHIQSFLSPSVEAMFSSGPPGTMLPILLMCGWALNAMREDNKLGCLLEGIYQELQITLLDPSREHIRIWDLAARNLGYLGHARQATALLEHVVKVRETTLVETHPDRLASQHTLAGAYRANGQTKEAVALLEHVVKVEETTLAETHPSRLASQHELASAYQANGQTKEAVALLEHVVKVHKTTLAETHPDRLASQHTLAGAYQANGQTKEAVALLEHVVKVHKTTLAETHPDRLASQHELARAYHANGQTKEAVALLEHVVKIKQTTLAETHPSRLASQHELASAYQANGQTKEAVALLEHVVKIKQTTLAETHPSRLASQHELASAYQANGQTKEAVALLEHVVKVHKTTLAETHPDRLASQHTLASAYQANGQTKEAVALLEHVVKVEETTLAETHPDRLASQHELAGAYYANGQTKEAVGLLEHVVKVHKTTLAETHPDRLASQHELASAYQANGQTKEAVALLEHVVKVHKTTLAETHPDRLASQHELAGAYYANGQTKEAVGLLEHVVKIKQTTMPATHPSRQVSERALAFIKSRMNT
ncbi:unnamed protein product [Alternaria alternata]